LGKKDRGRKKKKSENVKKGTLRERFRGVIRGVVKTGVRQKDGKNRSGEGDRKSAVRPPGCSERCKAWKNDEKKSEEKPLGVQEILGGKVRGVEKGFSLSKVLEDKPGSAKKEIRE